METSWYVDYLHDDIIFDILSFLPVEPLLRFKSVCKSWRSIISNPHFIQTHLANIQKIEVYRINYKEGNNYIDGLETPNSFGKLPLPPDVTGVSFIYSCNGLLCLSNYDCNVIYLWNPSIRRMKLLPAPTKLLSDRKVNLGFGFDSISNDYKLLRIGFKKNTDGIHAPEAELYSANADSWKEIRVCKTLGSLWPIAKFVHSKSGVLYLHSRSDLLAFDLQNEVFRLYPFPDFVQLAERRSNVFDFQGYIAVSIKPVGDGSLRSIYKLDNVRGKVCWTKMFDLKGDLKKDFMHRFWGIEHIVTRNHDGRYVFKYPYKKSRVKKFMQLLSERRAIIKHSDNLVSLDKFEQVERGK